MTAAMEFDGIDHVVLAMSDLDRVSGLYADTMGFSVSHDDPSPDPAWSELTGLDRPVTHVRSLARPRAQGGAIVLLQAEGLEPLPSPGPPARRGPYALDFYARDSDVLEERLLAAGWTFTAEPVHYPLPGTDLPVRERMLVQDDAGLLHAIVQHRPMGTRSVVGVDDTEDCSEVVAVVCMTPDLEDARRFAADALGGREYFRGDFEGPAMEEMLGMAPGERLEASLYRGPASRNARLEFAWRPGSTPGDPADPARVTLGIRVDDLAVAEGWTDHGTAGPVVPLRLGDEQLLARRFSSRYDVGVLLLSPAA
ncbi:hypothetical protein [Aeromicrobium sp. Leaf350]|uniref:hypothetical protein n=1 Tax=Aeromicrobium sp. Leaf350 TaxID=2876565 RepID=UPI001E6297B9|nr:hypothetical protein [Aeromicrobium sp. Leaf350]